MPEFGGRRGGVRDHDHGTGPERAEVAADETEARPGRKQHPVADVHPTRQPRRHLARAVIELRVGERLTVDRDRNPVGNPVRGRGRQRGNRVVAQTRGVTLHVSDARQVPAPAR